MMLKACLDLIPGSASWLTIGHNRCMDACLPRSGKLTWMEFLAISFDLADPYKLQKLGSFLALPFNWSILIFKNNSRAGVWDELAESQLETPASHLGAPASSSGHVRTPIQLCLEIIWWSPKCLVPATHTGDPKGVPVSWSWLFPGFCRHFGNEPENGVFHHSLSLLFK